MANGPTAWLSAIRRMRRGRCRVTNDGSLTSIPGCCSYLSATRLFLGALNRGVIRGNCTPPISGNRNVAYTCEVTEGRLVFVKPPYTSRIDPVPTASFAGVSGIGSLTIVNPVCRSYFASLTCYRIVWPDISLTCTWQTLVRRVRYQFLGRSPR